MLVYSSVESEPTFSPGSWFILDTGNKLRFKIYRFTTFLNIKI